VPGPPSLRLMTRLAARLLPYAATRTGLREPIGLHLVLTGPGGGSWNLTIGGTRPDPAAAGIVTDAAGFCRLAANRIAAGQLDVHITGDQDRAYRVPAAVPALALD
jgi:hypothetical protein